MNTSYAIAIVAAAVLSTACSASSTPTSPSAVQGRGSAAASAGGAGDQTASSAGTQLVPFKGSLEGQQTVTPIQPPFALVDGSAAGTGTHLGLFTVTFPHTVNFATSTGEGDLHLHRGQRRDADRAFHWPGAAWRGYHDRRECDGHGWHGPLVGCLRVFHRASRVRSGHRHDHRDFRGIDRVRGSVEPLTFRPATHNGDRRHASSVAVARLCPTDIQDGGGRTAAQAPGRVALPVRGGPARCAPFYRQGEHRKKLIAGVEPRVQDALDRAELPPVTSRLQDELDDAPGHGPRLGRRSQPADVVQACATRADREQPRPSRVRPPVQVDPRMPFVNVVVRRNDDVGARLLERAPEIADMGLSPLGPELTSGWCMMAATHRACDSWRSRRNHWSCAEPSRHPTLLLRDTTCQAPASNE